MLFTIPDVLHFLVLEAHQIFASFSFHCFNKLLFVYVLKRERQFCWDRAKRTHDQMSKPTPAVVAKLQGCPLFTSTQDLDEMYVRRCHWHLPLALSYSLFFFFVWRVTCTWKKHLTHAQFSKKHVSQSKFMYWTQCFSRKSRNTVIFYNNLQSSVTGFTNSPRSVSWNHSKKHCPFYLFLPFVEHYPQHNLKKYLLLTSCSKLSSIQHLKWLRIVFLARSMSHNCTYVRCLLQVTRQR